LVQTEGTHREEEETKKRKKKDLTLTGLLMEGTPR
jgi:hypothetical protein